MKNKLAIFTLMLIFLPAITFSQQGAASLRDFVGLINQSYHPGIVSYFERAKDELAKQKETDAVRNIEIFLSGAFGSGFLYNDARGNLYVITNNHVVSQAHTLSITFERADGSKRKVENLRIIATDVDADLALLAVPAGGERPFVTQGLTLLTRQIEEGEDVFSAGFPGLGVTPLWQFGRGMVSNASARFPRSLDDQTLMGPYIQHTAQVDAGNSGGPLLTVARNVPSGYSVAGINTLRATSRQAANFAIPVATLQPFITSALNPRPETFRAALDQRLAKFVEGFEGNSVYSHVSEFLSAICIGENAEYAFEEMWDNAGRQVTRAFIKKCEESIVGAMGIAIAWTIEESIKGKGNFTAAIKEVTGAGEEYTVVFTINGKDVNSVWIREYGNWRIKTFGTAATGDTDRLAKRQAERDAAANLRLESDFSISAGYSNLYDKSNFALYLNMDLSYFGLKLNYVDSDFWALGFYIGYNFPIPIKTIAITPNMRFGFDYQKDTEWDAFKEIEFMAIGPAIAAMAQFGLKVATSYLPGVFFGVNMQYNMNWHAFGTDFDNPMKKALTFSAGYAF